MRRTTITLTRRLRVAGAGPGEGADPIVVIQTVNSVDTTGAGR